MWNKQNYVYKYIYSVVLNCRGGGGGGGNFAIFWKFRPPFHFIMTPPFYKFCKKLYPSILFPPPHYMQNEYHSLLLKVFMIKCVRNANYTLKLYLYTRRTSIVNENGTSQVLPSVRGALILDIYRWPAPPPLPPHLIATPSFYGYSVKIPPPHFILTPPHFIKVWNICHPPF